MQVNRLIFFFFLILFSTGEVSSGVLSSVMGNVLQERCGQMGKKSRGKQPK